MTRTDGKTEQGYLRFIPMSIGNANKTMGRLKAAKFDAALDPELAAFQASVARNAPPRMKLG